MKSLKYRFYFPMTANVLTRGHIDCLKYLTKRGVVIVGLLTAKGLEGYKKEIVPFADRKYILENLNVGKMMVVPQDSLNPTQNIKDFKCNAIASGDGFEAAEFEAIRDLHLTSFDIKLDNEEVGKRYSSSSIIKNIKH